MKDSRAPPARKLLRAGAILFLAGLYYAAGKFGLGLAQIHPSASAIWPPTGIALAAFLVWGFWLWPGVFIGAFLVNLTKLLEAYPEHTGTHVMAASSLGIALGNTLEGLVGAFLVNRFAHGPRVFEHTLDVFKYLGLAALGSTGLSASCGVSCLALGGFAAWPDFGSIWLTWWLGDMGGALVLAPLLVLWCTTPRRRWRPGEVVEAALVFFLLVLTGLAVFGELLPPDFSRYQLKFLCVPFVLWMALRFGPREALTASFVLSCIAVEGTLNGWGPYALESPHTGLVLLQVFLGVVAVMTLSVAALAAERARGEELLRRAHDELELRIRERTAELALSVEALRSEVAERRKTEERYQALSAELERRVSERTEELQRSNEELESFAYVASHDLQEPLRMVASYLQLLEKRYRDKLDAQADKFIHYAVDGARRMQEMIHDLLRYSRAGRAEETLRMVDCNLSLAVALKNLKLALEESGAQMKCLPLPAVEGDFVQLAQVFQNLIGNAIKYRKGSPLRIEVSAQRQEESWLFTIRDNGMGFENQQATRIFRIFQRLHERGRYPGSGVGLAIAKKIVERHGGRIWAFSEPGQGSTFCFTLPAVLPRKATA